MRFALMLLIGAALLAGCSFSLSVEDPASQLTRVALDEQATAAALRLERLTQLALIDLTATAVSSAQPSRTPLRPTVPLPTAMRTPTLLGRAPTPPRTQPAQRTQTAQRTATFTLPTPASTGEGSIVRAPYDPATDFGAPDVLDGFSGENPLFPEWEDAVARAWYGDDGRYHISFITRGRWTWYWSNVESREYYADVLVFNGEQCVEQDSAGLLFNGDYESNEGWLFGVTCGGAYFIGITGSDESAGAICAVVDSPPWSNCSAVAPLLLLRQSPTIVAGPGAANRLGIMASAGEFTFFINGRQVDVVADHWPGWPAGHFFALYLGTGQRDNARVSFDDFSVWNAP
jgi:hypothetical protein